MDKTCLIKRNSEYGRYIVAAKSIKAGEVLFEEKPFAYGPKKDSPVVCLNCYCMLNGSDENNQRCKICTWPLCDNCLHITNNTHYTNECEIFNKTKVKFQNSSNVTERCTQLDCITPLRVLIAKENNPERWHKEISKMEDHEQARRNTETWLNDDNNIVKYLRGPMKLKSKFSEDLIQKVIGILEVNAFEAKTFEGYSIRCLYPKLAILAHSCVPNTSHNTFPSDGFKVYVRATIDVQKDEQLNSCYTYTLEGTSARQYHLKDGKYFKCRCKRCLDPTELGTHFSSWKCSKCGPGWIISSDPLKDDIEWKCTDCSFTTSGQSIYAAIRVIQSEVNRLNEIENGAERIQKCGTLFNKYKNLLHPRHFVQTGLRQIMIELYGRAPGYQYEELPNFMLDHKVEMCREILKILAILEPGKTRSRAMILYELHVPLIMIVKSLFASGLLTGQDLETRLKEIIQILKECNEIMEWADKKTQEGNLANLSKTALQQLQMSLPTI